MSGAGARGLWRRVAAGVVQRAAPILSLVDSASPPLVAAPSLHLFLPPAAPAGHAGCVPAGSGAAGEGGGWGGVRGGGGHRWQSQLPKHAGACCCRPAVAATGGAGKGQRSGTERRAGEVQRRHQPCADECRRAGRRLPGPIVVLGGADCCEGLLVRHRSCSEARYVTVLQSYNKPHTISLDPNPRSKPEPRHWS